MAGDGLRRRREGGTKKMNKYFSSWSSMDKAEVWHISCSMSSGRKRLFNVWNTSYSIVCNYFKVYVRVLSLLFSLLALLLLLEELMKGHLPVGWQINNREWFDGRQIVLGQRWTLILSSFIVVVIEQTSMCSAVTVSLYFWCRRRHSSSDNWSDDCFLPR